MLKASKIVIPVLAVAVVLGMIGVWDRLVFGKAHLAFGSYIPWGLWVGLYTYFVGVSGGAFLVAFLYHGAGIGTFRRPARYAVPVALTSLGAGLALVLLDLGQMGRFWTLFLRTNPASLLGMMVWVYSIYALVLLAMLVAMAREQRSAFKPLAIAGFVLVIMFGGGEGALFGVLGSKPVWNSGLLPIRFLFSALLTGMGAVAFATMAFRRWPADEEHQAATALFRGLLLKLLALNLIVEGAEISVTVYTGTPSVVDAYQFLMFGQYWWAFWVVQVGIGIVLPGLLLGSPLAARPPGVGLAGLLIAIGYVGTKQNVVAAGLFVPEFRTLPEAFVHPRLSMAYFPSTTEWLVTAGALGAAALAFVVAIEVLPFLKNHDDWGRAGGRPRQGAALEGSR